MTGIAESPDCHRALLSESVTQLVISATCGTVFVASIWVCHVNATTVFRAKDLRVRTFWRQYQDCDQDEGKQENFLVMNLKRTVDPERRSEAFVAIL